MSEDEQWKRLCAEVERQSGAILANDRCDGAPVTYTIPKAKTAYQAKTCNCRNKRMVVVRYSPSDDPTELEELQARGSGFARICAVCDRAGAWPRFAHALEVDE